MQHWVTLCPWDLFTVRVAESREPEANSSNGYCVPGTFEKWFHLILATILYDSPCYPHFVDEETELGR